MSALAILYVVFPLPLAYLLHNIETSVALKRWLARHQEALIQKMPFLRRFICRMPPLTLVNHVIFNAEVMVMLLLVSGYLLVRGTFATPLWVAVFLAFGLTLLAKIVGAIVMRRYVPGLVTSILLLPYLLYTAYSIWLTMSVWELLMLALLGLALKVLNRCLIHALCRK